MSLLWVFCRFPDLCQAVHTCRDRDFYVITLWLFFRSLICVRRSQKLASLSLWLSVSQAASLGDVLLAPACPIEKITLLVNLLCLTSGSETGKAVVKDKVFARPAAVYEISGGGLVLVNQLIIRLTLWSIVMYTQDPSSLPWAILFIQLSIEGRWQWSDNQVARD